MDANGMRTLIDEVEYVREDALTYTVTNRDGKEFTLSREFVVMSYGAFGRRAFTAEVWYFDRIGLR